MVGSAEEPAREAERDCTPEGGGDCLRSGGLYNIKLNVACDTLRYKPLALLLPEVTTA